MMIRMMPLATRVAPKSVAPKAAVRFGNEGADSAPALAFVRKIETALANGAIVWGMSSRQDNIRFLTVDGQTYSIKGLNAQVFAGGPPASYTLTNTQTGESLRYVGQGCFSGPTGRYSDGSEAGSSETLSFELTMRLAEIISQMEEKA